MTRAPISAGPDGNLWFTESQANQIGTINLTTHVISEFSIPTPNSDPSGIATGPDGNLWFTENAVDQIGMINPATHVISEFPVPTSQSDPLAITGGPDGDLWFTETNADQVGRIDPNTHAITEFVIPTALSIFGGAIDITAGPDGILGFTGGTNSDYLFCELEPLLEATRFGLGSSANTAISGQPVTITATVKPATGSGTPTGSVTFSGLDMPSTTVPLVDVGGRAVARFTDPQLALGTQTIIATYSGDDTFGPDAENLVQTVNSPDAAINEFPDPHIRHGPRGHRGRA